jgi:hypothetical protein
MIYALAATSQSIDIQVVDDTGLPVAGLVAATMPTIKYSLGGANADATITLSDLALITTAYSSGGVKERGEGVYRLDLPNAALATAGEVKIRGEATGKRVIAPWIDVAVTVATVTNRVTANADQLAGQTVTAAAGVTFPSSVASPTNITAGTITTTTNLTNAPTAGDFTAAMKSSLNAATPASTGSVTGDVGGKVLGGGAGTITGTGVRAVDSSGNAIAPAATALSTANWTNPRSVSLDNLDAAITSRLAPTTAGRTLDVSVGGEAGLDWANIGSPSTTVALTGTTVGTLTTYTGNTPQTGDSFARIGLAGVGLTNVGDTSGTTTLLSRLSSSRAGYLDNLNVGGAVASSAEVVAIQNNTRYALIVPEQLVNPSSGTRLLYCRVYFYDEVGNMEAPDSAPVMTLVNPSGTDRSSRLGSTTGTFESTGQYRWQYTATAGDTSEQLLWQFTVVEGGSSRTGGRTSWVTDAAVVDFTSTDRTTLNAIAANADVATSTRMATYTQPTGFLAATFPGTLASTTNITAGTITTTTNLTNLPTIPANWLTAAGVAAGALNGKGDWNIGKTGYSLASSQSYNNTGQTTPLAGDLQTWKGSTPANLTAQGYVQSNIASTDLAVFTADSFESDALQNQSFVSDIPTATENADALLARSVSNVEGSAAEHSLATLVLLALESIRNGDVLTIKKTDGTTTYLTKALTRDESAVPVVGIN